MRKAIKKLKKLATKNGYEFTKTAKHGDTYRHTEHPAAITNIGGTPSGDAGNYFKVKVRDLKNALEAAGGTWKD